MSVVTKRWKITAAAIVAVIVLIPFGLQLRAKWRLQSYRNELKRQGEKLDVFELTPPPDNAALSNGARLLKISNLLGGRLRELAPSTMRTVKPGKARVSWREPELIQPVDPKYVPEVGPKMTETNVWPLLEAEVAKQEQQLQTLRDAAMTQRIQYSIDYQNVMLVHLSDVKHVFQNLAPATVAYARRRDLNTATDSIVAMTTLLKAWDKEPLLISQLVRAACANIASFATWEVLQSSDFTEPQLKRLQEGWQAVELLPEAEHSFEVERALCHHFIELMRHDFPTFAAGGSGGFDEFKDHVDHLMTEPKTEVIKMVNRYPRYWGWCWFGWYETERKTLEFESAILQGIRVVRSGGPNLIRPPEGKEPSWGIDLSTSDPWAIDENSTLRRSALKYIRQQTHNSMIVAAIALERYRLQHGAYPKTLDEMVPQFLNRVPADYGDGKPLRYRLNADGTFLLYGVGDNGIDDGGDPTPPDGEKPRYYNGKDFLWPHPATPEEVKAFDDAERKATKN